MAEKLTKVKTLAPDNPNASTKLFGGQSSGALNWNDINYSHHYETYKRGRDNFWTPNEVDMSTDLKSYNKLTPREKDAFEQIIGLLAFLDGPQTRTTLLLSQYASDTAVQSILATYAFQESVHNESYSYVLSTLLTYDEQRKLFERGRVNPEIQKRNQRLADTYNEFVDDPSDENLAKAIAYTGILEGLFFYAGFAFFYNLARQNKMVGTSTMISYINKDELEHGRFIAELLRDYLHECPHLNTEELAEWLYDMYRHSVDAEIEWAEHVLQGLDGIDMEEMRGFIKYRANKMLRMIGLSEIYEGHTENPMKWIRAYVDSFDDTKSDFFEQKSRQYTKVGEQNGFDDL